MTWAALVAGCYLLGSISWSYLIVRRLHGVDVRSVGSGNAGAANVLRVSGAASGLATLALDAGKGAAAVAVAQQLEAPGPVIGGAATAVVLGHVFPATHGFRGGKGVATAAGAYLLIAPVPASAAVLAFLLIVLVTRYVSVGSVASVVLFPLFAYLFGRLGWAEEAAPWLLASSLAIAALIVYKHHDNVRRLRDGEELKLSQREEAL